MEHILSLSYGKDSLACLGAIEELGWPLDRIVHAEVWATDTIPADLPPMVEFKAKADAIIKERWGIEVEHIFATRDGKKLTYERLFYHVPKRKGGQFENGSVAGFPYTKGAWCNDRLKTNVLDDVSRGNIDGWQRHGGGCGATSMLKRASVKKMNRETSVVKYFGIAADEPERIARHQKTGIKLPLVEIGWDEAYCRQWCEENGLLSPIYTTVARGGCWFCHNQGVNQLRLLRRNYPELWEKMLQWDKDSPVSFKADGHTVHDFDRRFQLEDDGFICADERFRWDMLDGQLNYRWF